MKLFSNSKYAITDTAAFVGVFLAAKSPEKGGYGGGCLHVFQIALDDISPQISIP